MSFKYLLKSEKRNPDPTLLLKIFSNPTRRTIVGVLAIGEVDIKTLQEVSSMRYHGVYQHLKIMEEAQLIKAYKLGVDKYYALNPEAIESLSRWLTMLSKQLQASNHHHHGTDRRDDFGYAEYIGSNGRKENWHG